MPYSDKHFVILDVVDSTNNYAMQKVHERLAKHGVAYFSTNQTHGKGQRNKEWKSVSGQNIAISIVIEPFELKIDRQFQLSIAVSLAAHDFFNEFAINETSIKWPNDIYWRDRKAGGILIENVLSGNNWKFAIIGIGFNINQTVFNAELKNPVSLKQITGKNFDLIALGKQLHQQVMKRYQDLVQLPFEQFLNEYHEKLFCLNQTIQLKYEGAVIETKFKGVLATGQLVTDAGNFTMSEVEWII